MRTGLTPKLWTHMLAQGGRWTAAELAEIARVERKQVENVLLSSVNRGFVVRYEVSDRANGTAYGVTSDCRVPQDIHLKDILKSISGAPA